MNKVLRGLGWVLATLGVVSLLTSILVLFDPKEKNTDAFLGLVMFGLFFGVPGVLLLWRDRKATREGDFRRQFVGFLRTHDQFSVAEMAQKIGRTELETEQLIASAAADGIDLVFHRADRTYLHRSRVRAQFHVLERCSACGASLTNEIALEGEVVHCPYCGSAVAGPE